MKPGRKRRRGSDRFDKEDLHSVYSTVRPTLCMTWVHWMSVKQVAEILELSCETVRKIVRVHPKLRLHRGHWIKKLGYEEAEWLPYSDNPDDYLIRSRLPDGVEAR